MSEHPPLQQRKDSKRFGEKDLSSDEIKQQYKPASLKSAKSRIQLIHNEESRKVEDAVTKACAGKPGGGGLTRGETKTVIKGLFEDPRTEVREDGLTTMLAVAHDIVQLFTLHVKLVYMAFARMHHAQLK